jgi:imidazolonepropionase
VLTLRGPVGARRGAALNDLGIVKDGSVLIRDGRIVSVGPARRIENLKEARGAIEISAEDAIVLPGFVDPGLQLNLHCTKHASTHQAKRRRMADFSDDSLNLMRACLQHGTLNVQIKASAGTADFRSDLAVLKQLAEIGNNPVGMVRTWRITPSLISEPASAAGIQDLLGVLVSRKLIQSLEVAPECSETTSVPVWHAAARLRIGVNLLWNARPAVSLERLVACSNPDAVWFPCSLTDQQAEILSASRCIAVFSPGGEVLNGSGNDSVRKLADSGAALALSSGYHACESPSFNMQMAIALAVFGLRLTIEQAITAATINAAYAIRQGDVIGSIECGKRADLLVLSIPDYREIPRRFGINHVAMAMRDGNIVFNRLRSRASTN